LPRKKELLEILRENGADCGLALRELKRFPFSSLGEERI
jgi:hypothetical protein